MKPIWIEKSALNKEAAEWLTRLKDRNLIDPAIFDYPATTVLRAQSEGKTVLYVPIQCVYMLESLGISPDASPLEVARALYGAMQIVQWESKRAGHGEAYFLCNDAETVKFAEHNGMERVNFPLFRFKVKS